MITKLALRRLALRAARNPSLTPILHDALLEVFPEEYEGHIAFADNWAADKRWYFIVLFNPEMIVAKSARGERLRLWGYRRFETYSLPDFNRNIPNQLDTTIAQMLRRERKVFPEGLRSLLPVYLAKPPSSPAS